MSENRQIMLFGLPSVNGLLDMNTNYGLEKAGEGYLDKKCGKGENSYQRIKSVEAPEITLEDYIKKSSYAPFMSKCCGRKDDDCEKDPCDDRNPPFGKNCREHYGNKYYNETNGKFKFQNLEDKIEMIHKDVPYGYEQVCYNDNDPLPSLEDITIGLIDGVKNMGKGIVNGAKNFRNKAKKLVKSKIYKKTNKKGGKYKKTNKKGRKYKKTQINKTNILENKRKIDYQILNNEIKYLYN